MMGAEKILQSAECKLFNEKGIAYIVQKVLVGKLLASMRQTRYMLLMYSSPKFRGQHTENE